MSSYSSSSSPGYPLISSSQPRTAYSTAPAKTSLGRSVPSYEEVYSGAAKPTLKAYDIDLSIHIGASTALPASRIERVTCCFDEIDAYRPHAHLDAYKPRIPAAGLDLPLIVKPLRQFERDATMERRSRSTETSAMAATDAQQSRVEAAGLCRRRTMGGADDARPKWYSSSVDGGPESSTLPKNFLRKPSILHTAAPVQVEAVPSPDDDVHLPPKSARSFGTLAEATQTPSEPKRLEKARRLELVNCIAKPVQLVDCLTKRAPRAYESTRSLFFQSSPELFEQWDIHPQSQGVFTEERKRYPWHQIDPDDDQVGKEVHREANHFREDSGYRSDRKSSVDLSADLRRAAAVSDAYAPIPSQKLDECDLSNTSEFSDSDGGDFQWDDGHTNRFAISRRSRPGLREW